MKSNAEKGRLLEEIVESLCSEYGGSDVQRNVMIKGKAGTERQIEEKGTKRKGDRDNKSLKHVS